MERWGEPGQRIIDWPAGEYPQVATVSVTDAIRLLDLTGGGAALIGADARLQSETNYDLTQPWARAIFETGRFDGIWYEARKGGDFGVALFDTCEAKVSLHHEGDILDSPWVHKLLDVAANYGFVVEPLVDDLDAIHRVVALGITPP